MNNIDISFHNYRRIYVCGDIHGNMNDLSTVIALFYEDGYDHMVDAIVFLGDYVDSYGPSEARMVIKTIRAMMSKSPDVYALRGNHEQMWIDGIDKPMSSPDFQIVWTQGGQNTYYSYITKKESEQEWSQYLNAPKQMVNDIEWFKSLPTLIFSHNYFFVHAGLRPQIGGATTEQDRLWIRDEFLSSEYDHGRIVVHGHTSRGSVELRKNRINVDTSKYGKVSAVRLQAKRAPLFFDRYGKFYIQNGEEVYQDGSAGALDRI